ncbi:hypothetical protein HAX54_050943, partial [Datura stramonium]|nr:hypothetical protein [Datura stramonium]
KAFKEPVGRGAGHGTIPVVVKSNTGTGCSGCSIDNASHCIVALPTNVVMILLNVLESLVPNHGGLP